MTIHLDLTKVRNAVAAHLGSVTDRANAQVADKATAHGTDLRSFILPPYCANSTLLHWRIPALPSRSRALPALPALPHRIPLQKERSEALSRKTLEHYRARLRMGVFGREGGGAFDHNKDIIRFRVCLLESGLVHVLQSIMYLCIVIIMILSDQDLADAQQDLREQF